MRGELGRWVAATLRAGTLAAMLVVAAGMLIVLFSGEDGLGPRPVTDLLGGGGGDALIAAGLLGLALLPIGVLLTALVAFLRFREGISVAMTLVVIGLLLASLVTAVAVGAGGI